MRDRALRCMLIGVLVFCGTASASADSMHSGQAFKKLTRGAINTVTGWVELPKRITETAGQDGPFIGFTWGTLRGIGYGFIRTAAGLYELVTFPYPAPAGYAPVLEPEYVFTAEASTDSYDY